MAKGRKKRKKGRRKAVKTHTTEADIEARIHAALLYCFPHLSSDHLEHQRTFTVRIGRSVINLGAGKRQVVQGRLDILVTYRGKPLAILEIKRPHKALTKEDRDQGVSYALLTKPITPLVVVTNGAETRLYNSYTSKECKPEKLNEKALSDLVKVAASVAESNMDNAVGMLLGTDPTIWQEIVKNHTERVLSELSQNWDDFAVPFVKDFLIPRRATSIILSLLLKKKKLIMLAGPPLSGKSNVLRELAIRELSKSDSFCPLYVEGSSCQHGILQTISNLLTGDFFIQPNADAVRSWLLRLMKTTGHGKLLILIDDIPPGQATRFRQDIDDILSMITGSGVSIVLAAGEYTCEQMGFVAGRRQLTRLGRLASLVQLTHLNEKEFESALTIYETAKKIRFWKGVAFNGELHWPRYMRVLGASAVSSEQYIAAAKMGWGIMLPSVTGPELVLLCRKHWKGARELRSNYRRIAEVMMKESRDPRTDPHLSLRRLAIGAVSLEGLREEFSPKELDNLYSTGHIKLVDGPSGRIYGVPALPELATSETAYLMSERLRDYLSEHDVYSAADYLMKETGCYPLSDILGACILNDLAIANGGVPLALVEELLKQPPIKTQVKGIGKALAHIPDVGDIQIDYFGDGKVILNYPNGMIKEITVDPEDLPRMIDRSQPYLLLSQLAGIPLALSREAGITEAPFSLNFHILEKVGSCPVVLPRPNVYSLDEMRGLRVHHFGEQGELACHLNGIVEPVTAAITNIGLQCPDILIELTELGCKENRIPLLNRLNTAIGQMIGDPSIEVSKLAIELLEKRVGPKLQELLMCH